MDPDTVAKMQAMFGGAPPPPPQGMAQHLQMPQQPPSGLMGPALGGGMQPQGPPPPTGVPYTARPPMPQQLPPTPGRVPQVPQPIPGQPPLAPPPISQAGPPPSSGAKTALQAVGAGLVGLGNMKPIPQFHDAQPIGQTHFLPGFAPHVGPLQMPKNW